MLTPQQNFFYFVTRTVRVRLFFRLGTAYPGGALRLRVAGDLFGPAWPPERGLAAGSALTPATWTLRNPKKFLRIKKDLLATSSRPGL